MGERSVPTTRALGLVRHVYGPYAGSVPTSKTWWICGQGFCAERSKGDKNAGVAGLDDQLPFVYHEGQTRVHMTWDYRPLGK